MRFEKNHSGTVSSSTCTETCSEFLVLKPQSYLPPTSLHPSLIPPLLSPPPSPQFPLPSPTHPSTPSPPPNSPSHPLPSPPTHPPLSSPQLTLPSPLPQLTLPSPPPNSPSILPSNPHHRYFPHTEQTHQWPPDDSQLSGEKRAGQNTAYTH